MYILIINNIACHEHHVVAGSLAEAMHTALFAKASV